MTDIHSSSTWTAYPSSFHTRGTNVTHVTDDFSSVDVQDEDDYDDLLESLCKEWLLIEIKHKVSKIASNEFWNLAIQKLHRIQQLSDKRIAQFQQQRRKLFASFVPQINLDVSYANNDTDEIFDITNTESILISKYPRDAYTKLFESASVKVSFHYFILI